MDNFQKFLNEKLTEKRLTEIDYFRGFTIILMVFVNFIATAKSTPGWLKHAKDIGLTITDLVAPAFIYAIGLTYKSSFTRRYIKNGKNDAYYHFITRFLAIIGIGAFFTAGAAIVSPDSAIGSWGVLQAIGASGLITLIFIRLKNFVRLIIGLVLLIVYQIVLDKFFLNLVLNSEHGGLFASISWASLMILSTFFSDIFYDKNLKKPVFIIISLIFLFFGFFLHRYFPVSKHRISLSYVLLSIGVSSFSFYFFYLISKIKFIKLNFLIWWGQNPLFLYLLHMILLGVTFIPVNIRLFNTAPFYIIFTEFICFFTILSFSAYILYKKKIIIKI